MGEVFLAQIEREDGFTRRLVVKRMLPELSRDSRFRAMFVAEARIAASLNHPHVVGVTDFGRIGTDCFLAMEYVDGADLATLLQLARAGLRPPPLDFVLGVMLGCLRGLGYAHRRKPPVVHGDVSPANLLVGREGEVKLADFGIARVAVGGNATGGLRGKPAYMAPEVAAGAAATPASDLFSAGAVLYELLALAPPLTDDPDATRRGHIVPLAERQVDAHPALAAICRRALADVPSERFEDADQMEEALVQVARTEDLDTDARAIGFWVQQMSTGRARTAPSAVERTLVATGSGEQTPRRRRIALPALALLAAAAVILTIWATSWRRPSPQSKPVAAGHQDADPGEQPTRDRSPDTLARDTTIPAPPTPDTRAPATRHPDTQPPDSPQHRHPTFDTTTPDTRPTGTRHAGTGVSATASAGAATVPDGGIDGGPAGADPVRVASAPPGLRLRANRPVLFSLDGAAERAAPLVHRPRLEGAHLLTVRAPEGLDATIRLEAAGDDVPLGLAVRARPAAVLYLDGRARGMTPKAGLRLQPGSHTLTLAARRHPPLVLELELH